MRTFAIRWFGRFMRLRVVMLMLIPLARYVVRGGGGVYLSVGDGPKSWPPSRAHTAFERDGVWIHRINLPTSWEQACIDKRRKGR